MQSLDELLSLAASEPAHRPAFFRALLSADAWVPGKCESAQIDANSELDIEHWQKTDGQSVIPFFTSEQQLASVCQEGQAWLKLPVRTLFEITAGETLFLNPKLETGKEFTAAEIAALLAYEGDALAEQQVVEGETQLLLSEVTEPPAQLISSLTTLFAQHKPVRRAFLAEVRESAEQEANLLIGIEVEDNVESIINAAGSVAMDTLPEDAVIDICQVFDQQPGVSHFFTAHIVPFYERRWGSFLRDYKGSSRII